MSSPQFTFTTLLVSLGLCGWVSAQEPARGAEPPRVEKLPLPPDAIIIISENLRQAVGQMQPGSVILSPRRYQELMEELARLRLADQASRQDRLFSSMRLTGKVAPSAVGARSRLIAEIKLTLEFLTDVPGARVAVPLRGLALSAARLDGGMPAWADAEGALTLIIARPGTHVLELEGHAQVTALGLDRRLTLDQLPRAAATAFDLTVASRATEAVLKNANPPRVEVSENSTRISGEALGVLGLFDLSWKERPSGESSTPVLAVAGDQRLSVESTGVEGDARLRLDVSRGELAEMEIALPGDAVDLRAELFAGDERRLEPPELLATARPDRWRLRLKQPLTAADTGIALRLRWRQVHEGAPQKPLTLRQLLVTEPDHVWQSGLLTVVLATEQQAKVVVPEGLRLETREPEGTGGRGLAQSVRYGPRPLALAVQWSTATAPPLTEARWMHELKVGEQRLRLNSDLELVRGVGGELTELTVAIPTGWTLDPRLLQNPFVRNLEVLGGGQVRIVLATRLPSPLRLRLELEQVAAGQQRTQFSLPKVLAGQAERGGKPEPTQWQERPGKLVLTSEGLAVRLEAGTRGVQEENGRFPELDAELPTTATWQVVVPRRVGAAESEEPRLALVWQPLRPLVQMDTQLMVTSASARCRSMITLQWTGEAPQELPLIAAVAPPRPPRAYLRGFTAPGSPEWQPLAVATESEAGKAARFVVRIPRGTASPAVIQIEQEIPDPSFEAERPLQDLAWPDPAFLNTTGRSQFAVWCPLAWQPTLFPGDWEAAAALGSAERTPPRLLAEAASWKSPPAWRFQANSSEQGLELALPKLAVALEPIGVDGRWEMRLRGWVSRAYVDRLHFELPWPRKDVQLLEVRLDQDSVSALPESGDEFRIAVALPPEFLSRSFAFELRLRLRGLGWNWRNMGWRFPAPRFGERVDLGICRWYLAGLGPHVVASLHGHTQREKVGLGWLDGPAEADPGDFSRWLGTLSARTGSDPAAGGQGYGFVQRGRTADLELLILPRGPVSLIGSLLLLGVGIVLAVARLPIAAVCFTSVMVLAVLIAAFSPTLLLEIMLLAWPGAVGLVILLAFAVGQRIWLRPRRVPVQFVRAGVAAADKPDQAAPPSITGSTGNSAA